MEHPTIPGPPRASRARTWRRYLRFWGPRAEADVNDELRFHRDMLVLDYIARGMTEGEAHAAADRRLGDIDGARTACEQIGRQGERRAVRLERMRTIAQDLRLVMRTFGRHKAWTTVVVLTLALGIGANSALFTIINAVLLRPLPYPNSGQILSVSESDKGTDRQVVMNWSYAEWLRSAKTLESIAATGAATTLLRGAGDAEEVTGARATASYFTVLSVAPIRGRVFTADEDAPGTAPVVVLSEQLWRRVFAGDTTLVGKTISLDGTQATVLGIMPASFTTARRALYWIPYRMNPVPNPNVTLYYTVVARVRPGVSVAAVQQELTQLGQRVDAERGPNARKFVPVVMSLHARRYGDTRPALLLLLGAVGVLLLIACANVSNLLLARASRRHTEFAVRAALGATPWRLVRYLLAESVTLALMGGALGLLIAALTVGTFVRMSPGSIARAEGIRVDGVVLAFTFVVAVATGILFGLFPAIGAGRANVSHALTKAGTRGTIGARRNRLRRILVIGELATALVLVTGAGLLTRSFARARGIDPGFRPDRVLTASVHLSRARYATGASAYYEQLVSRVRTAPGVESVGLSGVLPFGGVNTSVEITVQKTGVSSPSIDMVTVGADYFETLGIRVIKGRVFTADDRADAPQVIVISEAMARAMYPDVDPIGQQIHFDVKPTTVVGVVADQLPRGLEGPVLPVAFVPVQQDGTGPNMVLLVRTSGDPMDLVAPVRDIARALDPQQPMPTFATLESLLSNEVAPRRFSFALVGVLASLAAILAAIGLYGVMSYLVEERSREIGIRVALGADRAGVMRLIVGQGMWVTTIGIVLGLAGSAAAVRLMRTMLYQVSIYDPWTFVGGPVLLAVVAFLACYLPARRATRVDPMTALRAE